VRARLTPVPPGIRTRWPARASPPRPTDWGSGLWRMWRRWHRPTDPRAGLRRGTVTASGVEGHILGARRAATAATPTLAVAAAEARLYNQPSTVLRDGNSGRCPSSFRLLRSRPPRPRRAHRRERMERVVPGDAAGQLRGSGAAACVLSASRGSGSAFTRRRSAERVEARRPSAACMCVRL
jgi:hypothetical protein